MKPTINIDASSLSASSCVLHWYRVVGHGYRDKISSASIVYGQAVHKYIDMMYKTKGNIAKSRDAAFEIFRKPKVASKSSGHLMDEKHLLTTCYTVWEDFIKADSNFDTLQLPNGEAATELTFSLPYYEDDNVIIRLTGTIDRLGKIRNGCYCIRDFKTTSKYNVQEYLNDYKMSKQLRFYNLALRLMAQRYPDSILGQVGATQVGACIDGIFLKSKASENQYISSPVFMFSDDTMKEFQEVLDSMIKKLSWHVANNTFPREGIVNGTCRSEYKCKFFHVCGAPVEVQQVMLDRDFMKVHYNPLAFNEV